MSPADPMYDEFQDCWSSFQQDQLMFGQRMQHLMQNTLRQEL